MSIQIPILNPNKRNQSRMRKHCYALQFRIVELSHIHCKINLHTETPSLVVKDCLWENESKHETIEFSLVNLWRLHGFSDYFVVYSKLQSLGCVRLPESLFHVHFETWYMTIQRSIRLKWAFDDKNNNSILQGRALLYAKTIFWLQYSLSRKILKKGTA